MKEARERQRRRRQRVVLSVLLLASLGGIGYGIDRGLSNGHPAPACSGSACSAAGAVASSAAPIIVSVLAEPGDLRLSSRPVKIVPGKANKGLTVVPAPRNLAFKVTLRNGANSPVTAVSVRLTVYRTLASPHGAPIDPTIPSLYRPTMVETKQAKTIGPSKTEVITIGFGDHLLIPFAEATKIKVDVTAVTSGNLAVKRTINYPVIFSLP